MNHVQAQGFVGNVGARPGVIQALTGVSASGQITSPGPDISLPLTNVSASGLVNTVSPQVITNQNITGVESNAVVGVVTPIVGKIVALSGVSASGVTGSVYNPSWIPINTVEDAQWELINTV